MKSFKCLILILLLFPSLSLATNLRGRVDAVHAYASAPFPARGVLVELLMQTQMGPKAVNQFLTGNDGMYYFQNITPGDYILIINNVLSFNISVNDTYIQDISPILLRY